MHLFDSYAYIYVYIHNRSKMHIDNFYTYVGKYIYKCLKIHIRNSLAYLYSQCYVMESLICIDVIVHKIQSGPVVSLDRKSLFLIATFHTTVSHRSTREKTE